MQDFIKKVLKNIKPILGSINEVKKINVGFTNTLYSLDNKYILKICNKKDNESNFKKEINFYLENKENNYIPKLLYYSIDKIDAPYFYEILEKVEGSSLYNVWHTFNEEQRKNIIKKITVIMKMFHSIKPNSLDWCKYINNEIQFYLEKIINEYNYFNKKELEMIDKAIKLFSKYLINNDFTLVHNDIHFDNIIYNKGDIKIIDFERSMIAPKDYELDIFFRMTRMPEKFASEEAEKYVNSSDYAMIPIYMKNFYPEIVNIKYLDQRLAIYDILYFLKQAYNYPKIKEFKNNIISSVNIVLFKEVLTFDKIKTSKQLMQFMVMNIKYGWIDSNKNLHLGNLKGFREQYKILSKNEILNLGVGTCIESAVLAKNWFDSNKIETKLFCHRSYETENNFDKEVKMHIIILFNKNNNWYHFEHSNYPLRGIHKYKNINEALNDITSGFEERGDIRKLTEINNIPSNLSFKEFNDYINQFNNIYEEL